MKLKKLLSIAIDCMGVGNQSSHSIKQIYDENDLCRTMEQLILYFNEKGHSLPSKEVYDLKEVVIIVKDEQGEGTVAQVKFYPMLEGVTLDSFSFVTGDLTFFRTFTQLDGTIHYELPLGRYYVEVSKGSEYEIIVDELSLEMDSNSSLTYELKQFINLKEKGWYAGDLHHHSVYSSRLHGGTDPVVETPEEVGFSMQAMGLSYGALSDHHNTKNHREWEKLESKKFTPILSKEISTSNGHVLSLGVDEDIIYKTPKVEDRTDGYLRGEFIRITDRIKELGGLPQLNHPRDRQKAISWNPDYYDIIDIFETIEIWNGSNPMRKGTTNWDAFLLWLELLEEGRYIPATTGSDTHNIKADDYGEYLRELTWLMPLINQYKENLPSDLKGPAAYMLSIYKNVMPMLEKWAKTSLTSGCVQTYTYTKNQISTKAVLEGLKKGHSFLTNGPILIPEIESNIPGDTLITDKKYIDMFVQLRSNRPVYYLNIYRNGGRIHQIELEKTASKNGFYDYSRTIKQIPIEDTNWIFLTALSDCTNLAITNPIFIKNS